MADEIENQKQKNKLIQEENQLLQKKLDLQSQSLDVSSSLVESLKETLGIKTRTTTFDQNLLKINKDINKTILNQKTGLTSLRDINREISKNSDLINGKLNLKIVSLAKAALPTDKARIEQIKIREKALFSQNEQLAELMNMSKEERDVQKTTVEELKNKIASNEKYVATALDNMSLAGKQLLLTQQQDVKN